jgi:hypothetical protein
MSVPCGAFSFAAAMAFAETINKASRKWLSISKFHELTNLNLGK